MILDFHQMSIPHNENQVWGLYFRFEKFGLYIGDLLVHEGVSKKLKISLHFNGSWQLQQKNVADASTEDTAS